MTTLQEIKAKHIELGERIAALIAKFEGQAKTTIIMPAAKIELDFCERYAGLILGEDGTPSHHLILLPGAEKNLNWKDAKAWAEKVGGELPSRQEQALLFTNLKGQFQEEWYWSNEQHAVDERIAWCQDFGNGSQHYLYVNGKFRARAVRRLAINDSKGG